MATMKEHKESRVRYDSAVDFELVKMAAKKKRWSVNRFLIEVSLEAAKLVMTEPVNEGKLVRGLIL